jgi:tRNA G18 (ribose-2'-O)-methylase SpoU
LRHGKRTSNIWIRAIIEAIQASYSRQSLYSERMSSELMKDLMKVMKCQCKLLLCSCRKLNRPNNHQGAVKHLSYFLFDLETLIDTVVENGKPLFLIDQISDARNFAIIRTECTE